MDSGGVTNKRLDHGRGYCLAVYHKQFQPSPGPFSLPPSPSRALSTPPRPGPSPAQPPPVRHAGPTTTALNAAAATGVKHEPSSTDWDDKSYQRGRSELICVHFPEGTT
ncbi:Hypp9463 [Branchiostoma lanceolatum]|uniref:Hypp9463 protein n=1 Tax=Branchiostoma lanceolatum TaxID=7740 RepID=A0A8S4MNG9_BRALA|nr:Hypp9463 [Branchiostoma lanceolatum]